MTFKWLRTILKVLIAFLLVGGFFFGYTEYKRYPIESFCSEIPQSATAEQILMLARKQGFENIAQRPNEVLIFNQWPPMWRFVCDVNFKDGRQISKEVIGAD